MSIQSEIERINNNVANTYSALEEMGAEMPIARNSNNLEGTVRSVNVATPVTSAFEIATDTLVWDGNTEGLESFDMMGDGSYMYYHVSDNVLTLTDLSNGATFDLTSPAGDEIEIITLNDFAQMSHDVIASRTVSSVLFVSADNINMYNGTIPKKGVYFMKSPAYGGVAKLTVQGYTGFNTPIMKECNLPNWYASKEDVSQLQEEIDDQNGRIEEAVENEKGNIAQLIINELQGLPVFGVVDSNNNITVTSQLSKGTYTLKYECEDGSTEIIGTITITGEVVIVNLLESAVGVLGTVLNDVGYADGYYLSGNANVSGNNSFLSTDATHFTTGFIPYTKAQAQAGVPIYVKGITLDTSQSHTRMGAYPSYNYSTYIDPIKFSTGYISVETLGNKYYKMIPTSNFISTINNDFQYIRFSFTGSGAGVVITVGQEIPSEPEVEIPELFVPATCSINKRLSSSGAVSDQNSTFVTDYIDIGDLEPSGARTILFSGFQIQMGRTSSPYTGIEVFDSSKARLGKDDTEYNDDIEYDESGQKTFKATVNNPSTSKTARYIRVYGHLGEEYSIQGTTALTGTDQLGDCSLILA